MLRFEFLGTGTSTGVPCIGCSCAVCSSSDPRNKRLRCAGWVRTAKSSVLIDAGPDLRYQMLRAGVPRLDAIFLTHFHADHVFGIDEVRRFNYLQRQVIDCYADAQTLERMVRCFDYIFSPTLRAGIPSLKANEMRVGGPVVIGDLSLEPLDLDHHVLPCKGLLLQRIGGGGCGPRLAYCVDCKRISDETVERIRGVEVLVLDMLRPKPHPTHLSLEEALALVERIGPGQTFFSHMAHEVDHQTVEGLLPDRIRLAYDGLVLEL